MYFIKEYLYKFSLFFVLLAMALTGSNALYADKGGKGGDGGGGGGKHFGGGGGDWKGKGGGDWKGKGGDWKGKGGDWKGKGGDWKGGDRHWRRDHDDGWRRHHRWRDRDDYWYYFSPWYWGDRSYSSDCYYDRYGRLVCWDPYSGTWYIYR